MAWGFDVVTDVREGEVDGDVSGISDSGAPLAASTNNQSVKLGSSKNEMTVSNDTNLRVSRKVTRTKVSPNYYNTHGQVSGHKRARKAYNAYNPRVQRLFEL